MAYQYGLDVSSCQGRIDWAKVKSESNIKFVSLRCLKKGNVIDAQFMNNYNAATFCGYPVTVYHYIYDRTTDDAVKTAQKLVSTLKSAPHVKMVWLDWEGTSSSLGKQGITDLTMAYAFVLRAAGYTVGIYCAKSWYNTYIDAKLLTDDDHMFPFWIAKYGKNDGQLHSSDDPKSCNRCIGWQYTSAGSVPGISGNVDLDICYWDYDSTIKIYAAAQKKLGGN